MVTHVGRNKKEGRLLLHEAAYHAIVVSCTRFANRNIPNDDWREVYGLMIGYVDRKTNDVVCTECVPMTHTREIGPMLQVQFEEQDYVDSVLIEDEAATRDPPQWVVGWFHSHPGIKIMFTLDDIKTMLGWATNNPLAVGLVFNPVRLVRQIEVGFEKGDKELVNDPGFEVFRLDDPSLGTKSPYHAVEYQIVPPEAGAKPKPKEQIVREAQELVFDTIALLPRDSPLEALKKYVELSIEKLNSEVAGVEAYVDRLRRSGEHDRIPNVLKDQRGDVEKLIEARQARIRRGRELIRHVEYKERAAVESELPAVLQRWEELVAGVGPRFDALAKGAP